MSPGNIFNSVQNDTDREPGETLEQYGINLTKLVNEGKLDTVIGRHQEIR